MIDLRQKSIVVTGGASGIGAAICATAYKEGATVGVIDIDGDAALNLCKQLGRRAYFALGDVESESSMNAALEVLSSNMPVFNGCVASASTSNRTIINSFANLRVSDFYDAFDKRTWRIVLTAITPSITHIFDFIFIEAAEFVLVLIAQEL